MGERGEIGPSIVFGQPFAICDDTLMEVVISPEQIDSQPCDVLVTGFFEDERPLQGASGWVDWRLNGRFSRILMEDRVKGTWQELTLMPSEGRLRARLILLIGLGRVKEYSYLRLRELSLFVLNTLEKLRVAEVCISFPYGEPYNVDCGKLVEIVIEAIADGLEAKASGPKGEGPNPLRLYFAEGEERFPEILLGARTAKSIFQGRSKIRLLIPSEKNQPAGTS